MFTCIALVFVLLSTFLVDAQAPGFVPGPPTTPHPRFMHPQMRIDWAQMVADAGSGVSPASGWYQFLQNHGSSDWTGSTPSWLTHHPITMYQINGSAAWATLCWNGVQNYFLGSSFASVGGVTLRIYLDIWVDVYDWLYPALTSTQQAQFRNKLFALIDAVFLTGKGGGACCNYNTYGSYPLRATDTDELIHNYFSLLKVYALTGDEDPYIANRYLNNVSMNVGGFVPQRTTFPIAGGRCASGCYDQADLYPDMRTTVAAVYYKYTSGGAGWYPSGYMLEGIDTYIAINWAYLRIAFGVDYFPEVGEGSLKIAMRWMKLMTPDFKYLYRFADDDTGYGGTDQIYSHFVTTASVNSWFSNDTRIGYCWYVADRIAKAWPSSVGYGEQYDAFFIGFAYPKSNPGTDMTAVVIGDFSWDIYGLGSYRSGWTNTDSFFGYEWQPYHFFDHFTTSVGGFMHYRKGEWSAYQPVSYGSPTGDGQVSNTMTFYSFPQPLAQVPEYKGLIAELHGSNWAFTIGAQSGSIVSNGSYSGTSTFIQEYSRATIFVHGTKADIMLIFDRSNILNPSTLPYFNVQYSYWTSKNPTTASAISSGSLPRRKWRWHIALNPTVTNTGSRSYITWPAANSGSGSFTGFKASTTQTCKLETHFTATTYTSQDEKTIAQNPTWSMNNDQYGFLASEVLQADAAWDATLHVLGVTDNGFSYTTAEYVSTNLASKMIVVQLPGSDNNVVALYNVVVGPTIKSPNCCGTGASPCGLGNYPCLYDTNNVNIINTQHFFSTYLTNFSFTGVATTTSTIDLFLNDLNAAVNYSFFVDAVDTFTVTSAVLTPNAGFFHYLLTGVSAGSHTFCFEITGTGACGTVNPTVFATNAPVYTDTPTASLPTTPTTPTIPPPLAPFGPSYSSPTDATAISLSLTLMATSFILYTLLY